MKTITQKELHDILQYDSNSGIFTWKVNKAYNVKKGMRAGCIHGNGYLYITINRKQYASHRLVWLYIFGVIPSKQIDHINHIRADNRLINLREATHSMNQQNRKMNKNNTTGVNGVQLNKKNNKFDVKIQKDGKKIYLGSFSDIKEAKKAREEADIKYGYHKNHGKIMHE